MPPFRFRQTLGSTLPPLPDLPALPDAAPRPYVALNMVMSVDGKVSWGQDDLPPPGASGSIGSALDRAWMQKLRLAFDAVARGAGTWRRHPYYPGLPDQPQDCSRGRNLTPPRLVLFTRSGELLPTVQAKRAFRQAPRPILVLAGPLQPEPRRRLTDAGAVIWEFAADAPAAGAGLPLAAALARLRREAAIQRLLLEGGPHLNYEFLRAHLIDELFLTLAPRLIGRSDSLTLAQGPAWLDNQQLELVTVHRAADELFLRYRVSWGTRTAAPSVGWTGGSLVAGG